MEKKGNEKRSSAWNKEKKKKKNEVETAAE